MTDIPSYLIPSRAAKRTSYDQESIYAVLDEAMFCTVSYSVDNRPYSVPTSFVRYDDKIYIHGSVGSHFMKELERGGDVCITIMMADALVVAKAAFSHTVNYRSVVIFSNAEKIENMDIKRASFEWLTEKIIPGSWNYLRPVKVSEIRKTTALAFSLEQASLKMRSGMPNDEKEDLDLPIWSGIIPLETRRLPPVATTLGGSITLPAHLTRILD
ncbi:pyridoxamine 5'-phosphate oxidase family protein [Dyadobacter sp. CY107]|uniref:pyridoxamine 5'-phosphate oxidase family protein n=1 Tax=Dyadobacter fanqingshengii TaxID=2906443 RepID=UPI001F2876B8|nr:pyridoxamine 5'-phosphate oxidase family protein [Dyadobacter fanqingshengii]MCF2502082.1 pyridoxamine 5'-phosphate oxidase family protein [Dyadobacter fanqingshengii]